MNAPREIEAEFDLIPQQPLTIEKTGTELTVKSPTEIEATSPAGPAGQVDVTATTPGGTSTPAAHFTYVEAPSVENGLTGIHPGPFDFPTQTTLPLRGEVNSNGAAISACYFGVAPQSEPAETVAVVPCEPPPVTEDTTEAQ